MEGWEVGTDEEDYSAKLMWRFESKSCGVRGVATVFIVAVGTRGRLD